ncbi:MAG TPA: hypothetical protein VF613_06580 [Longimicrobium sp.]|jgi:hypothetical protein
MFLEMRVVSDVLYAEVSGEVCVKAARELFSQMMAEYVRAGAKCILIDCRRVEGTLGVMQRYELGVELYNGHLRMIESGYVPPRIAIVAVPPLFDSGMLMESVAVNRGARFRAVQSLEEAAQWLGMDAAELSRP